MLTYQCFYSVWSLQASTKTKLRAMALLGAGGVTTATSIVRLVLILKLDDSPYQLGDQSVSIVRINILVYVFRSRT